MTIQYLKGLRFALVGAALVAVAFVPVTDALAQRSLSDRGGAQMQPRIGTNGDDTSNIEQPRLYPRANYVWPYETGPYYGDVPALAIAEGVPGIVVTSVGSFNLAQGEMPFPAELKTTNRLGQDLGMQYFLVATSAELDTQRDVMGKIEAAGGAVVEFLANGALVARLTPQAYAAIQDSVGMMAITPYHPALKLSADIGRHALPDPIRAMSEVYTLDVMLWPGEDGEAVAAKIASIGVNVIHVWGDQLQVEADRNLLPQIASLEPVKVIYEALPVYAQAEETTTTMQTGQYNMGAIPYHDAGVKGGGANFGFCDNGTEVCRRGFEATDCTDGTPVNGCNPNPQILMVLDSGIQLDAGDLSDTRTSAGTPGASHRKVLAYETTGQFGGVGDLLGCDSPAQGGFTHGHTVSAAATGWATAVGGAYGAGWNAFDQQGNPWKLDGVAPQAKVIAYDGQLTPPTVSCADPLQDTITPGDLWNSGSPNLSALGKAYNDGARVINFSWGTTANTYNANSGDIDGFLAANRDAMVFVSAGNQGQDIVPPGGDGIPDELTVGAPATSKNALAIGASRNADTTNQPNSREFFSSVGPAVNATTVNRIAPQLMAPGGEAAGGVQGVSSEYSCRSSDNDQANPVQCDVIQGVEGTSFSSPAAAGAALLVRDYFFQGFYPNRVAGVATSVPNISGALVKAILVASADFMDGANLTKDFRWNNEQGAGRIQLDNVLPLETWPASTSGLVVHDTLNGVINVSNLSLPATISTGTSSSAQFDVCNDEEELRIVLAWNDIQNQSLRNNLNLTVTSPSGKEYRGNYFSDDNNRNGVPDPIPGEDCPPIGGLSPNGLIDEGPWSLPTCSNSAIPGFSNNPVAFDQTNVIEGVYLSPDADDNCNTTTNQPPDCYNDGACVSGDNPGGLDGNGTCGNDLDCTNDPTDLSDNPACDGGTRQPEIGTWTVTVAAGTPFTPQPQDFSVVITGGVCVTSSVKFNRGFYTCNAGAEVQVTELAEVSDPDCNAGGCPISTIQNRTTVRAFDGDVEIDCEGPGCLSPSAGLDFAQSNPQALVFSSQAINLTDGTVAEPGNGTLDIRDGYTVRVTYDDNGTPRNSSATVNCQVNIGFGSIQFAQFGQDTSVLVQGGCERAVPRQGQSQGFFDFGFPDRYMDADELIQFNVAFNSEETEDLENVAASLRCVNVDEDSPAACLPSGSGCEESECGGTCDPRRENNTTCPWLSVLDSPKFIGRLPAGAAISANFAIEMASDSQFGNSTPTVEMLLEISGAVAGKTASGLAVSRQRLNIDETEVLYNTDYPTGGMGIVFDFNNNEVQNDPITDLAGFQALDYRFETRNYGDLTDCKDASGADIDCNTGLQAPWNFDGGNGGFINGLASVTDEASAQSNLIANWGEDKNFNGIEDGTCVANPAIACYDFPTDPRCPGGGSCQSIENNNSDTFFTQNHSNRGGCGWQTLPNFVCTVDATRGCFVTSDCAGTCQQVDNSIVSSFDSCGTALPACPFVQQCSSVSANPLGICTSDADCGGGVGSCESVPQSCVGDAGTCDTGTSATTGGVWHTGRINDFGVGPCNGAPGDQCANYKVITSNNNTLIWWELLLTPVMQKVDQSIGDDGLPNSEIQISFWAWNQAVNLADNNVAYSWEFDTDTETIFPVDLVGDGTALDFAVGSFGAVANANNPDLTNGFGMFAPMGKCSNGTGACVLATDCVAGSCSLNPGVPCYDTQECIDAGAGTCLNPPTCNQEDTTQHGADAQGNNRVGQNSCFFEGPGTIPPEAYGDVGLSLPQDDDIDQDGDSLIDEFVTAAGPIRNTSIVSFNGPDMRFSVLEDIFGDTGNTFQGSVGLVNFEGTSSNPALQSYGLGVDDMYVEWKEFTLDPDQTSCATGSCAAIEVPTTNVFQGNTVLGVSILEDTPYNSACVGGTNTGKACFSASPDCPLGACLPTFNDCNLNGIFNEPGDDDDCNNNGTLDIVAKATSESDIPGVILVLDKQGATSREYRANLTVSLLAKTPGSLFLAQNGDDSPTITVTYLDYEDGTGRLCQNNVIPDQQGLVQAVTTAFIPDCDLQVASTSLSDNGDGDLFADTNETVNLSFSVRNNCGLDLTGCSARLSTNSEFIECIKQPQVALGTVPFDGQGTPQAAPSDFVFKVSSAADRQMLGLTPDDTLSAAFSISLTCNEIDANTFPQSVNLALDLNLSDLDQTPFAWAEGFESGTLGKFFAENLDAGIPGNSNAEGLANGDGWRCQYNNPDWVNGSAYGDDAALDCFPGGSLAQADDVFWQADGATASHNGPKRAKTGMFSMYYGVFLTNPDGEFTTPVNVVESSATVNPINLGVNDPELSFWHQVTLADHRFVAPVPPLRSADRGVVQIQLAGSDGNPSGDWTNLQPVQNAYDEQAVDNFFSCTFDPVDDGNNEDDFFDPTDPDRDDGPSSTCFPEFSYGFHGDTDDPFNVSNIGNSTTPPAASDSPSLGPGTWVETRVDLSEFRGRRARIRFLATALNVGAASQNWEQVFENNPDPRDDGWWIDDVEVDEALANPAELVNDQLTLGTCSVGSDPCVSQCRLSFAPCSLTVPCGAGEGDCVAPCSSGTCSGPAPECGDTCGMVTASIFVEPDELINPATVVTAAPGQVVGFDAADPAGPSFADSCLSGTLQYRFCISADPDGGGPGLPDDDCEDDGSDGQAPDAILRDWTENASLAVAPQASGSYVVEVRCSTDQMCAASQQIDVNVNCPGGTNGLALKDVRAADPGTLTWAGQPLNVDTWTSVEISSSSQLGGTAVTAYPGSTGFQSNSTSLSTPGTPSPNTFRAYLVKADGALNTIDVGFFCNSKTWRSGGASEIPEDPSPDSSPVGRDTRLGNP